MNGSQKLILDLAFNAERLNNRAVGFHISRGGASIRSAEKNYLDAVHILFQLLKIPQNVPLTENWVHNAVGGNRLTELPKRKCNPITLHLRLASNRNLSNATLLSMVVVVLYNLGILYDQVTENTNNAKTMFMIVMELRKITNKTGQPCLLRNCPRLSMFMCYEMGMFFARSRVYEYALMLYDEAMVCALLSNVCDIHDRQFDTEAGFIQSAWAEAEATYLLGDMAEAAHRFDLATATLGLLIDTVSQSNCCKTAFRFEVS